MRLEAVSFNIHISMYIFLSSDLSLNILHVLHTNSPLPIHRIIRNISLLDLSSLQTSTLCNTTRNWPLQHIRSTLNGEISERNFQRIAVNDRRQAEERGIDFAVRDLEFEVSAVVEVIPVQLLVVGLEPVGVVVRGLLRDVLAVWAWGADS